MLCASVDQLLVHSSSVGLGEVVRALSGTILRQRDIFQQAPLTQRRRQTSRFTDAKEHGVEVVVGLRRQSDPSGELSTGTDDIVVDGWISSKKFRSPERVDPVRQAGLLFPSETL